MDVTLYLYKEVVMLVLARRPDEKLTIYTPSGDKIEILVTEARQGMARLGITAPPKYVVLRDELLQVKDL
jgi:carbon storage regulator CsrA